MLTHAVEVPDFVARARIFIELRGFAVVEDQARVFSALCFMAEPVCKSSAAQARDRALRQA